MKISAAATLAAILLGTLASAPAVARHHGGHVRFGVVIGGPIYPWWYYPPYYYPPATVVVPAAPPTYIEQGDPDANTPPQQQQGYWYYCGESQTYYPYVKECPGGWQRVTPRPAPGG